MLVRGNLLRLSSFVFSASVVSKFPIVKAMSSSPPIEALFGSLGSRSVVHATQKSIALGDLAPILPGHCIVTPKRVVEQLQDLDEEEVARL
jgi:hypothetical protein